MISTNFSVLMSVYYKEIPRYLEDSLKSIFNQSVIPNELILVEDGRLTEKLDEVVDKYCSLYPNIMKVVKFKKNRGLGKALHDGLLKCSNEIVFRMDSDDICVKDRFKKTLQVIEKNNFDVVGGNIVEYDSVMNNVVGKRNVPENDVDIKTMMKKRNAMNHVTVAFKKSKVVAAGNYLDMPYFEDYYLWARMIKSNCIFYNIQETLVNVRGGNEMIKRRGGIQYIKCIVNFEKALLKLKIIDIITFTINVLERIFVSIIPRDFRTWIYKKILRSNS